MKYLLKTLAFIPLGIDLLLLFVLLPKKVSGILWTTHIPILILLVVIGIGICSKKKIIQQSGNIALVILTAMLCIIGYYDYIQWFSSIVGIIIFMYFTLIGVSIKKLKIA